MHFGYSCSNVQSVVSNPESDLRQVRDRLLLMVGRVEQMIAGAVHALVNRDIERARSTIARDQAVNKDEVDLDRMCIEILTVYQLEEADLRMVTVAMKMVTDLERIGDLAVNICERAIQLANDQPLAQYEKIPRMGMVARSMVQDAIDAFIDRDEALARAVLERDDEVDDLYETVFEEFLDLMVADGANVHRGIHYQSAAKYLERIGDHSTNLAEQVIFMLDGTDIRHPKLWRNKDQKPLPNTT